MTLKQALKTMTWTQLRKIQSLRVVQSMYIWLFVVPVLAKSLSALTSPAHIDLYGYEFQLILGLPFSWQAFYFAALLFVLGNLAFTAKCPNLVKDHESFESFNAQGKGLKHLHTYNLEIGFDADGYLKQEHPRSYFTNGNPEVLRILEAATRGYFWELHYLANRHSSPSILSTSACYGLGLILISWVFIENLISVITLLASNAN